MMNKIFKVNKKDKTTKINLRDKLIRNWASG